MATKKKPTTRAKKARLDRAERDLLRVGAEKFREGYLAENQARMKAESRRAELEDLLARVLHCRAITCPACLADVYRILGVKLTHKGGR